MYTCTVTLYFFISLVAWVGSMVSIFIVSLGSLIGVVATPFTRKFWFPYLIMFLIALSVAVLVGDAVLHLLPHVSGLSVSMWYPCRHTTSFQRQYGVVRRRIDVEMTSCVYGDPVPESIFTHSMPMFHFYTP